MAGPLTKRQCAVFQYVAAFIGDNGYAPSLHEIGDAMGLRSLATVSKHIATLQAKGYVDRRPNRSRSISLLFRSNACPTCGHTRIDHAEAQ